MATPRVFVSSTFYDLKPVREQLEQLIRSLGFEPVLSEYGHVHYSPRIDTEESCRREVRNCQILFLVVGGRYGSTGRDDETSITRVEYREAHDHGVPILAVVDADVLTQYHVYQRNKDNPEVDETKITYPSVNDVRVFHFIEEVRSKVRNNALQSFNRMVDVEDYFRKQCAGLFFELLQRKGEYETVAGLLLKDEDTDDSTIPLSLSLIGAWKLVESNNPQWRGANIIKVFSGSEFMWVNFDSRQHICGHYELFDVYGPHIREAARAGSFGNLIGELQEYEVTLDQNILTTSGERSTGVHLEEEFRRLDLSDGLRILDNS